MQPHRKPRQAAALHAFTRSAAIPAVFPAEMVLRLAVVGLRRCRRRTGLLCRYGITNQNGGPAETSTRWLRASRLTVVCCRSQESYDFLNQPAITTPAASRALLLSGTSPHLPQARLLRDSPHIQVLSPPPAQLNRWTNCAVTTPATLPGHAIYHPPGGDSKTTRRPAERPPPRDADRQSSAEESQLPPRQTRNGPDRPFLGFSQIDPRVGPAGFSRGRLAK